MQSGTVVFVDNLKQSKKLWYSVHIHVHYVHVYKYPSRLSPSLPFFLPPFLPPSPSLPLFLSPSLSLYSGDEIIVYLHGSQLTTQYFEKHGFTHPVMIKKKDGLGIKVPSSDFQVSDVEKYVGKSTVYMYFTCLVIKLCMH